MQCSGNSRTAVYLFSQCTRLTSFTRNREVLDVGYVVISTLGCRLSIGISLLIGRSLNANVNVAFAGEASPLVVDDIAVRGFKFKVVAVHRLNIPGEKNSLFSWLRPFLTGNKRLVLVGDWNAILDPKLDRVRWSISGTVGYGSSLIDFIAKFDLVVSFCLDHPGSDMWMLKHKEPSHPSRSCLDRLLEERTKTLYLAGHKLVLAGFCLAGHKLVLAGLYLAGHKLVLAGFVGYLMLNRSFDRNSSDTISPRAGVGIGGFIPFWTVFVRKWT